jgi:hypothetical protein
MYTNMTHTQRPPRIVFYLCILLLSTYVQIYVYFLVEKYANLSFFVIDFLIFEKPPSNLSFWGLAGFWKPF